ncbi:glycosyltransferase [Puteibacter caeruleilacunae]|nr:glycosyltransferase [Puteibacter caeruleilacunae]
MSTKICVIYNYAQHYRKDIFCLMDRDMNCDFVFGDKLSDIKKMNYEDLKGFKKEVKNVKFVRYPLYYQKGILSLLHEEYTIYLMLGESICVSTWLMLILAKFTKKRIYLWSHGWYGKESMMRSFMKKIFFSLAQGVFLYGKHAKNLMMDQGIKKDKLHVIYNSMNYLEQRNHRKKLKETEIFANHFNNNFSNLIFIGRLTTIKQLPLLVNAVSVLRERNIEVNLTFVGGGEMENELKDLVAKYRLEKYIWFYGPCYDELKIAELLYNADLCVSPGNVGLTAMHVMGYGTPVITHDCFPLQMPEFEAIKEGVTGAFFKYGDLSSLVDGIKFWLSSEVDRESVRKKCFEVIDEKYNPNYQIEVLKKYLN